MPHEMIHCASHTSAAVDSEAAEGIIGKHSEQKGNTGEEIYSIQDMQLEQLSNIH